ncbi:Crossover junction endodeoxyribonuclease RuvC [Pirellula sp. SH-Sr6A]|uniref:crossover junction endodeoxyribonuclease RuvC n=1 Tax=Pirellula sp. SH-Sr6A TaxID=1632865 RepID=UPI00078C21CB|nr:crossover junction endodeoxyribonuclease RuvC [Pirellula sp. SH-Sr6A]AMV34887.1 Crossover junction endodeoxyribonuclease RuvC [Pirellula sp. SH-Sr6A]
MSSTPPNARSGLRSETSYVLGIDPGLAVTGYGVILWTPGRPKLIEAGVIRVSRNQSMSKRLLELHCGISEVIESYPIVAVAIEQLYSHYARPRTAILMGHARGVLTLAAAQKGISVHSYEPTKVKKLLTGNGRAPKDQMQRAVQMQFQLKAPPDPPDVADALAIALCHYYAQGPMAEIITKSRKTK